MIPNDQFLLYCFDGTRQPVDRLARHLAARAATLPELRTRVAEVPGGLDYPYWVRGDAVDVRTHDGGDWVAGGGVRGVREAVAALFADQLDPRVAAWRLHLFGPVVGAPRCTAEGIVVVLQISHALADGRRASDIARRLLTRQPPDIDTVLPGRWGPVPAAAAAALGWVGFPTALARTVVRGAGAVPARSELDRRTEDGDVPPPADPCPPTSLNTRPGPARDIRLLVRGRADLAAGGSTVTVGGLTAISLALERLLTVRGEDVPGALTAEVTVARPRRGDEHNAFGNVSVPLHPGTPVSLRRSLIGRSLRAARDRAADPAWARIRAADASVPAVLARIGIRGFDIDTPPPVVGAPPWCRRWRAATAIWCWAAGGWRSPPASPRCRRPWG
ncbi:wax ester/triacylglycerol synthase domain-containing protein [Tsukamurella soli]|uniref:wax ester/triacylglycerol synthase domain-containing protein n=1 Tax=Tsukamurella soli TaxID=644556 RepID=UPI0036230399